MTIELVSTQNRLSGKLAAAAFVTYNVGASFNP